MKTPQNRPATDTICAIATPPGQGGVGIVRISGPATKELAQQLCGRLPEPRKALYTSFLDADGRPIDTGLVLFFPAPHSFTGEDVLELQGHGGPVVLQMLMQRVMNLGARAARAGEFSERAFLNDKLDLAQAEAIADLVTSGTQAAARAAQLSLSGVFSEQVQDLQEKLLHLRVFVEAAIDFPEEEIDFLAESDVHDRLLDTSQSLQLLLMQARQGRLLRDGVTVSIIGRPNAGKSSLLNALSGQDSAIVTEIPGTTRDVLREWIDIDGIPVQFTDTAGIRPTSDRIEAEGVKRARAAMEISDLVLLIVDAQDGLESARSLIEELPQNSPVLVVYNKIDLLEPSKLNSLESHHQRNPREHVMLSALTGQGMEKLSKQIRRILGASEQTEGSFSARQRHVDALRRSATHLDMGTQRLTQDRAPELLAEELRLAHKALGEITGEMLPDDLLGAIFSTFCIGK